MKSTVNIRMLPTLMALDARRTGGLFRTGSGTEILLPKGAETTGLGHVMAVRLSDLSAYTIDPHTPLTRVKGSVTITEEGE